MAKWLPMNSQGSEYESNLEDGGSYLLGGKQYTDHLGDNNPSMSPTTTGSGAAAGIGLAGAMATANPYLIAGAAAFQVVSGLHQAETIRMNAAVTARINEMNAQAIEYDAWQAELQGYEDVASYQPVIDQTVGDQRVAFAAQNVDVNFGTAKEIQEETRLTGFLNTVEIQKQARARALGLRRQARSVRMNSSAASAQAGLSAQNATTSGIANGAATAISGYARR